MCMKWVAKKTERDVLSALHIFLVGLDFGESQKIFAISFVRFS